MHDYITKLSENLNLTRYQENRLRLHYDKYNVSRLEKRGGLLYAPYVAHGVFGRVSRMFFGVRADLIGKNKTMLQAQRNIKLCANGFHCVKVGRYTYYADSNGKVISQHEFLQNS
ncbi:MAG: hypothetical protein IKZ34_01595 [Alphaproteobacteria bacterium]|jgi:hypothetical protein|nr:hypothetical protein [Alphaproteobacteria bacterium]